MSVAIGMQQQESMRAAERQLDCFQLEALKARQLWAMLHADDEPEVERQLAEQQDGRRAQWTIFERDFGRQLNRLLLEFCGRFCNLDLFAMGARPARDGSGRRRKWAPPRRLAAAAASVPPPLPEDLSDGGEGEEVEQADDTFGRSRAKWIQFNLLGGLLKARLLAYTLTEPSRWYKRARRLLWPRLVLVAYLACSGHLCYYLYHQYAYDFYRFRLGRVRWLNRTTAQARAGSNGGDMLTMMPLEREDLLLERIATSERRVRAIGAPHMHLGFAVQCFYELLLIVGLFTFLISQLYFKYRTPFNFYFIRNFLDYANEQRNTRALVRRQVRRFIDSSRNYTRALVEFSKLSVGRGLLAQHYAPRRDNSNGKLALGSERDGSKRSATNYNSKPRAATLAGSNMFLDGNERDDGGEEFGASQLDRLVYAESLSCKQLRQMLAQNDLRPINQTVGWVRRFARHYATVAALCLLYGALFDLILVACLFRGSIRQMHWSDLLVSAELLALLGLCNVTTIFYTTVLAFTCIDQVHLANKLRLLIEHTICLNTLRFFMNLRLKTRFQHLKESRQRSIISLRDYTGEPEDCMGLRRDQLRQELASSQMQLMQFDATYENRMNNDILLALMHYRIFVAQLMPLKRVLRALSLSVLLIMFLFPIIGRLHLPYFEPDSTKKLRLIVVAMSCAVIVPVNLNLIPVCYFHKRCTNLYDQLNRLLAHATEIISYPEGRDVYDRHIISMLRKEMCHQDWKVGQFAIKISGLGVTYSSLVRLHFYFGFIIISIIVENQASQQEVVGTLFNDPLGLF